MFKMRGVIEIPLMLIFALLTGATMALFNIGQKPVIKNSSPYIPEQVVTQKSNKAQIEPTPVPAASATKMPRNPFVKPSPSPVKPTSSPSPMPSSQLAPVITQFTGSALGTSFRNFVSTYATIQLIAPDESPSIDAEGQTVVELYALDPYNADKIASFKLTASIINLKPNTDYALGFAPTIGGGWIGAVNFKTDSHGNASFRVPTDASYSGVGIAYSPSNPVNKVVVYQLGENQPVSLIGNFVINSNNTVSAVATPKPEKKAIIRSITPAEGNFETWVTINGVRFGSITKNVWFYNREGINVGGGPIESWSDTEIKTRVPFVRGGSEYLVEVETATGLRSNRVSFKVLAGQPQIQSITPGSARPGDEITVEGIELGDYLGSVNFYHPAGNNLVGSGNIVSWSDNKIIISLPASLALNQEYGIQVVAADGRKSSFKYYQIGN